MPFCAARWDFGAVVMARRSALQPGTWSPGRDDLEALAATDAVDVEVGVEREDPAVTMLLSECDQSGIGEIHGSVGVLVHQPGTAFEPGRGEVGNDQATGVNQPPERPLSLDPSGSCQEVHRLSECRPCRHQRQRELVERLQAGNVVRFIGVDEGDERSSVGERQLRARSSAKTLVNASPECRARPPPPWTVPTTSAKISLGWSASVALARSSAACRMNSDTDSPLTVAAR